MRDRVGIRGIAVAVGQGRGSRSSRSRSARTARGSRVGVADRGRGRPGSRVGIAVIAGAGRGRPGPVGVGTGDLAERAATPAETRCYRVDSVTMNIRPRWLVIALTAPVLFFPRLADAQDPSAADRYEETDPTALVDFHAALDPNGSWVDDTTYGTVWVPNPETVGTDFVPYGSSGHWSYGDDYTWVSDYDWGWAPFHYGRWVNAVGLGWSWIPGREYAPAWVSWRVGEPGVGFVGWAPAPPAFAWRGGVAVEIGFGVSPRFVYCGSGELFHPHVFERFVRGPQRDAIAVHMHPFEERRGEGGRFFGPPPARIGIEPGHVVRVTGNEPGLAHARDFGRPSVAVRYGARPPEHAEMRAGERGAPTDRAHGEHGEVERPHGESPPNRGQENRPGEARHAPAPAPARTPAPARAPAHASAPSKHGR